MTLLALVISKSRQYYNWIYTLEYIIEGVAV